MTEPPQWLSDATPEQLRELLACVDCMTDDMVRSLTEWAREETPWYMGIRVAIQVAREGCERRA